MLDPIWIGVIINLCGNVVINIAHNAVKYANYMRRKQTEDRRSLNSSVMSNADQFDGAPAIVPVELGPGCCRSGWCSFKLTQFQRWYSSKTRWDALGAVFFVLGNIANFVSLGFAPQSMLAACGSVQFATNVFCELYFKGQAITGRVLKATCVILTGNALIVAFASHESPQLNVDELFRLYFEPAYDVYCVILFAAIVALYVFYEETKKRVREYQRAYDRGMLARIEAGDPSVRIITAGGVNAIALSQHRDHQHLHLVHLPDGASGQSGGHGSSGGHEHTLPSGLNGHMHAGASIGSGSGSSGEGGHGIVHGHQASGGDAICSDSGGGSGGAAGSGHSGSGGHHHHALYGMGALAHGGGGSGLLPVLPPMPTPIPTWRLRMLPFSYASISAIIGTQSVLLAKSMAELLRTTADGRQQFSAYFTWVILAAWLSSMLFWMYRMTTALRKFDKEPLIIPVLQVVWTIFSIVGGGIYFQEFMVMSTVAIALFVIGVLMLLAGVYLLTPESHSDPSETLHLHHGMHLVQSSQLSNHMHLSDVELQNLDGPSQNQHTHSPYGLRQAVGMGGSGDLGIGDGIGGGGGGGANAASTVNSVSPPGAQMHFRDSHSHSHSHHGGGGGIVGAEKGSHSSHSSSSRSGSLSKGEHQLRPSGSSNSIGGGGSGSASMIGQGGGSGPSDDAVMLAPPPGKITRVTSTGRIQIQSAPLDSDEQDHYVVEVSPEFRPYESALSGGGAAASSSSAGASTAAIAASSGSTRAAHKLHPPPPAFDAAGHDDSHDDGGFDDESLRTHHGGRGGKSRTASIDEDVRLPTSSSSSSLGIRGTASSAAAAASSSSAAAAPGPAAQSMGILSEAGLLGSGAGGHHHHQGRHMPSTHRSAAASRLNTPPLHPALAFSSSQWGTPVRGPHPTHLDSVASRPASASGHHSGSSGGVLLGDHLYHHSSSTHNSGSIPPSPALYGYDIYASLRNDGAVKRGRGMSLGFSMPMLDMDMGEEQK